MSTINSLRRVSVPEDESCYVADWVCANNGKFYCKVHGISFDGWNCPGRPNLPPPVEAEGHLKNVHFPREEELELEE